MQTNLRQVRDIAVEAYTANTVKNHLSNITICIYHGEQREVKEVGDLVKAIEQPHAV